MSLTDFQASLLSLMNDPLSHTHQILVVDDHPVNQLVLTAMLAELHFDADTAVSGPEAIKMAGERDYDLIFMDIQMPDMDGYETTRQIRQIPIHLKTPVIAMTASTIDSQVRKQCENRMDELLGKPFDTAELKKLLQRWLQTVIAPIADQQSPDPVAGLNIDTLATLDTDTISRLQSTFAGAEKSSLTELIEVFTDTLKMLFGRLNENILDGDIQAIGQTAHALKSSSGNVGAHRFMSISGKIEQLAIDSGVDQIGAMARPWMQLQKEYKQLLPELSQLISQLKDQAH